MAAGDSTVKITPNTFPTGKSQLQSSEEIYGTFTVVEGNYVANGIPLVWVGNVFPVSNASAPYHCTAYGIAGYVYAFDSGHNSLRIFRSAASPAALGEMVAGGACGTGITGDTISFRALFSKD
jgi:hypothetical protein